MPKSNNTRGSTIEQKHHNAKQDRRLVGCKKPKTKNIICNTYKQDLKLLGKSESKLANII